MKPNPTYLTDTIKSGLKLVRWAESENKAWLERYRLNLHRDLVKREVMKRGVRINN